MKKAQSSIEFMILIGFAMIVVSVTLALISSDAERRFTAQNEAAVQELFDVIETEINLARISPAIYTREFFLPQVLQGQNYSISLADQIELVVNFNNNTYVHFLNQSVSGNLQKGQNTLVKTCSTQFSCEIRFN
ncbi:MAG: hypothetical protein ACMXX9_00125 [Candidatus Woesearchaeota archaeon]